MITEILIISSNEQPLVIITELYFSYTEKNVLNQKLDSRLRGNDEVGAWDYEFMFGMMLLALGIMTFMFGMTMFYSSINLICPLDKFTAFSTHVSTFSVNNFNTIAAPCSSKSSDRISAFKLLAKL